MVRALFLTSVAAVASASKCGTWCEDNGHAADACDCGVCGSFGLCSFSCTPGGVRVACPTEPTPAPTPAPTPEPTPVPTPTPTPSPGPGGIEISDVTISGLKCDGIQEGHVVYPKDSSRKYPLLSFAHGWTEGAGNTKPNYKNIIEDVAAAGYVVIAEHSGATRLCYDDEKHDQLRAIDYIKETPEFAGRVDWNSKVGVYGHSMGGAASGMNAADASAVSKYNLGAAVCLHPAQGGQGAATRVPAFFFTGTSDKIVAPGGVESMYNKGQGPKVFASLQGANHFECQTVENGIACPHGETQYTIRWFNCHIKGVQSDCDTAWGICDSSDTAKAVAKCHTANRASLLV
jgi:cephalosporin-C deacetylase-like acetyl esterase